MADDRAVFTPEDERQLAAHGIAPDEARRQLELLRHPPGHVRLVRPCTVGDGIVVLAEDRWPELLERHRAASARGRLTKFVPASGAASRMFRTLLVEYEAGGPPSRRTLASRAATGDAVAADVLRFLEAIERFPFATSAMIEAARAGRDHEVLELLFDESGLGYASMPKGLILFHRYPGGARTAFDEHLAEAVEQIRDETGRCRLHFTVSPAHREEFERARSRAVARFGDRNAFEISFSEQEPRTDTIAAGLDGRPFRDDAGRLVLRPGGHGALIHNLAALDADLVLIKNIDNVVPDHLRAPTHLWKKLLTGLHLEIEERLADHADQLAAVDPPRDAIASAREFVTRTFGLAVPADTGTALDALRDRLARPLRVCGVVRNQGEPGGGPFWVQDRDGRISPQIVEASQIDPAAPDQQAIRAAATHFNPVDLVCGLRRPDGTRHDLLHWIDPDTAFVSRKSHLGRDLLALEWPGLWNGAMAGWNTVFVEVPQETFAPVKTVFDLLRPEHQPPGDD